MHAPEESFRLSSFFKGREACARILAELADAGKANGNGGVARKATVQVKAKATGKASGKTVKAKAR